MTIKANITPQIDLTPKTSRYRWVMLGLVWLLYFSFGLTITTIAPLVIPIVEDLNMTYGQMGFVLGTWQLIYIFTAYPLGYLVDRFGVRKSLGVGIFLILMSLVLRGWADNFLELLITVSIFGFGGPIISIGAPKVVSLWFIGNERGLASGIYSTGPVLGAAVALATSASVVVPLTGSWRGISPVYGSVVFLTCVMWCAFAKSDHKESYIGITTSTSSILRTLITTKNVQLILMLAVAAFFLNHSLNNWLPAILQEKHMTLTQAGYWAAISMIAGIGGLLLFPSFAVYGNRKITLSILFSISCICSFGLIFATDLPLYAILIIYSAVRLPIMPILTLVLMETREVGSERMGAAGGLFFAAAEIGGFGGPFLLGVLRDITGSMLPGLFMLGSMAGLLLLALPRIDEK